MRQFMIFTLTSGAEHVVHAEKGLRSALQDGALFLQVELFPVIGPGSGVTDIGASGRENAASALRLRPWPVPASAGRRLPR